MYPVTIKKKLPGICVFHSTVKSTIDEPAGLDKTLSAARFTALHLARRGYVVLSPECYIFRYRNLSADQTDDMVAVYTATTQRMLRDHPDWTGMTQMIWDGMRAIDFFSSLPFADPARIGSIGFSLGGKESFYLAAFDERVGACVASEFGIGLDFSNWDASWYLGKHICRERKIENSKVLALIAPRPFLLVGGESADGRQSLPYIEAVRPIYKLFEREEGLGTILHTQGHVCLSTINDKVYRWLDRWLK